VRCIRQQAAALVEGLEDELQLARVERGKRLLEVPDAAMDEFCGLGRSAGAKVVAFDEGDGEAAGMDRGEVEMKRDEGRRA